MATIKFGEFAQLLYPYCGQGKSTHEFVVTLTNKFMLRPGVQLGDGYINPLIEADERSLKYYYTGEREIPDKIRSQIMGRSDKVRFEQYIKKFTDNAIQGIVDDLEKKGFSVDIGNVEKKCADIMNDIILREIYEESN